MLSIWVLHIAKTAQTGEKSDVVNNHVVGFEQNDYCVIYMCCCMSQVAAILRQRGGFCFVVELLGKVVLGPKMPCAPRLKMECFAMADLSH
jgi:hypothetical protein